MKPVPVKNPFNAPVYYEEILSSTMDSGRELAAKGTPHGTVISAGFQEKGRGRRGRSWETEKNSSLMFTVFLDYKKIQDIPKALTLKTGLAVAQAVEDFIPELKGLIAIKWPNDIMLVSRKLPAAKKTAGILCECDNGNVFIGIGMNLVQKTFDNELSSKACSLLSFLYDEYPDPEIQKPLLAPDAGCSLLEKILFCLHIELRDHDNNWKDRLENKLYKRGDCVEFIEGGADSRNVVRGILSGIGDDGELIIKPENQNTSVKYITGELRVY